MENKYTFTQFDARDELIAQISQEIHFTLENAIKQKSYASIALSGGSTPKDLFKKLSCLDLDWQKVFVTLVDERWVDNASQESNEKLVKDFLLQNKAKNACFIPLKVQKDSARDAIDEVSDTLQRKFDSLDIAVLGMGNDAHTASFFPNCDELEHALASDDIVCATTASVAPKQRITLCKNYLLKSQRLFLHIQGEAKKEVFLNACTSHDVMKMPIIAMMQQSQPMLEVYYAD